LATLVRLAHQTQQALPRALRDAAIVGQLSPAGRQAIEALLDLGRDLADQADAWQALSRYLFERSAAVRSAIAGAARGDFSARRTLAALGQLVLMARNFVRQAPPQERGPAGFVAYARLLIEAGESPGV